MYNKEEKAILKFHCIISDYKTREELKELATITGIDDFKILSHWSRSIEGCDYDLEHPNYLEYKEHYQIGDVPWLEKGYSYVKMKEYKEWKNAKR